MLSLINKLQGLNIERTPVKIVNEMLTSPVFSNLICPNSECDVWYKFERHIWRIKTKDDILDLIKRHENGICSECSNNKDDRKNNDCNNVGYDIDSVLNTNNDTENIKNIEDIENIENIYTELKNRLLNENFHNITDTNENLIAFENGVFEMKSMIFRKGCPTDYLTQSVGYNYFAHADYSPKIGTVMLCLNRIQPDNDSMVELMYTIKKYFRKVHIPDFLHNKHTRSGCKEFGQLLCTAFGPYMKPQHHTHTLTTLQKQSYLNLFDIPFTSQLLTCGIDNNEYAQSFMWILLNEHFASLNNNKKRRQYRCDDDDYQINIDMGYDGDISETNETNKVNGATNNCGIKPTKKVKICLDKLI